MTSKPQGLAVDDLIEFLISNNERQNLKVTSLKEQDMIILCNMTRNILMSQPMLLELSGSVKVLGDIHGQFTDLLRLFNLVGYPDTSQFLFLGDYVDRGRQSLEVITLLFAYKVKYPTSFHLLRGNHECQTITRLYGFFDECRRRFSVRLWRTFLDVFNCLPIGAIIEEQIFACHGGLSPEFFQNDCKNQFELINKINSISRPVDIPEEGLICDMLWSDPVPKELYQFEDTECLLDYGFADNERGVSYIFNEDTVERFCRRFGFELIIRAHQVMEDGYEFFCNRHLVTIFSAPKYCGEFDNAAAVFSLNVKPINGTDSNSPISKNLEGIFEILHPESNEDGI